MKRVIRKLPLIFVYFIIVYFSVKKTSGEPPLFNNIDKLQHFIAYFTLGFTALFSLNSKKNRVIILIASLLLGISLEYIQGILPYRDMSFADGLTNAFGIICGALLYLKIEKKINSLLIFLKLDRIFI